MKFVCDACGARYRIEEERVRGKVLKVRCKRCSHIIEVRAPRAVDSPGRGAGVGVEWHVAVNGVTEGPLGEDTLVERFRSGNVGDEAYVWNDGFSDWKPAFEVPAFDAAMRFAKSSGKRDHVPRTQRLSAVDVLGGDDLAARVSQRLEALKADVKAAPAPAAPPAVEPALDPAELATLSQSLSPTNVSPTPHPPAMPEASGPPEPTSTPDATLDELDVEELDELDGLEEIDGLEATDVAAEGPAEAPSEDQGDEATVITAAPAAPADASPSAVTGPSASSASSTLAADTGDEETVELSAGTPAALDPSGPPQKAAASSEAASSPDTPNQEGATGSEAESGAALDGAGKQDAETAKQDGGSATQEPPPAGASEGSEAEAAIAVGALGALPEVRVPDPDAVSARGHTPPPVADVASAHSNPHASGLVPLPSGVTSASASAVTPSASLLFQVKQAKQQRNRTILIALGVLLLLGAAGFALTRGGDDPDVVVDTGPETPSEAIAVEATAMNAATMSQNQRVATLRVSRVVANASDAARAALPQPAANEAAEEAGGSAVASRGGTNRPRIAPPSAVGANRRVQSSGTGASPTRARLGSATGAGERQRVGVGQSEVGEHGFFGQVGQTGTQVAPQLDAPELRDRSGQGPTPEHFTQGLQTFVSSSIRRCAQRQLTSEGSLGRSRVVVQMDVQPSGRVSSVRVDREIRETPFDRCLQTHRERWVFDPFDGPMTTIERTYLVQ